MKKLLFIIAFCASALCSAKAQVCDVSLFMRTDSVHVSVIDTTAADLYRTIGNHGPCIENGMMALRIYFNNSGAVAAIDVYNKSVPGLELRKYEWHTTPEDVAAGAGLDEYIVGKTVGLGGIALWDGEKEVKLVATKGRRVEVKKTSKGAEMYMLSRGVEYKGDLIDVKVTVRVCNKSRVAELEAECVSGQKVVFLTGVNFHSDAQAETSPKSIAVWGLHPPGPLTKNPQPVGGAIAFNHKVWNAPEKTSDLYRITTRKAVKKCKTRIVAACSRESELNSSDKFFSFVRKM